MPAPRAGSHHASPSTNLLDVFRTLHQRIGFHTYATKHNIPAAAGVYAWVYPFTVGKRSIGEVLDDATRAQSYCPPGRNKPGRVKLNWEKLKVSAEPVPGSPTPRFIELGWENIQKDADVARAFAEAIMVASVLARPLYVGLATDLRRRYEDHVTGRNSDFHERFASYCAATKRPLRVADLIFVAIPMKVSKLADEQIQALEWVLKHACQPPFGIR